MVWLPLIVLVVMLPVMASAWLIQRVFGNAGWTDVLWTYGTGLGGIFCAIMPIGGDATNSRQILVAALVLIWSLRLGTYVALRVGSSPREDVRYARFRQEWGAEFQSRMFRFIIVQAPIAALLALAMMVAARRPGMGAFYGLSVADLLGAAILLVSIVGEAASDMQMRRCRKKLGGSGVCRTGLWSLSRHPNYVFEWLFWLAFPIIALGNGNPLDSVWPWFSLIAPLVMYGLLVHVSGIPPLEREMLASRGDAYRRYQAEVPAFLPFLRPAPVPASASTDG